MSRRRHKLPRDPVEASIDNFNHELKGVARIDGKATFVQGALPGESVRFKYTLKKKTYDEGTVTEVLNASDLRTEALCKHYDLCGGCSLQHLKLSEQIMQKQHLLAEMFASIAKVEPLEWLKPLVAKQWAYRNKARLSVRYVEKKQATLVGFRERNNGRFITDIERCEILNPKLGQHIIPLRDMISSLVGYKSIAQVELAASENECALIFRHLEPLCDEDLARLIQFGEQFDYKVFLQPKGPDSVVKIYPKQGDDFLSYRLEKYGLDLKFHPNDFTQVNASMNELMVNQAMDLLAPEKHEKVLDLFCGLGNFSLPLARLAQSVRGVEGSEEMVLRATDNAEANAITNTEFYVADLSKPLSGPWVNERYDKILIDPPRCGALEIVSQVELFDADKIVYVSCNPATLARDSGILVNEKGYQLTQVGVMDMFSHTAHVESMALFER